MRALHKMGYKLYASLGTADFYNEHGVEVCNILISKHVQHHMMLQVSYHIVLSNDNYLS